MEKISPFLLHLPERINPDELFLNVAQIQVSKKVYDRVRKKTTEQARANAAELEHLNGVRRDRSAGHLAAAEEPAPDSILKKALKVTRDTFFHDPTATSSAQGSLTITPPQLSPQNGKQPQESGDSSAEASTAASVSSAGSARKPPAKKSGAMECLQS